MDERSELIIEVHLTEDYLATALRDDVRSGLTGTPKSLPPKWFYDAVGSELFERITELDEYYPTRTERRILQRCAAEVARITEARTLVELGSGSSEKTRLLLDALSAHGSLSQFVPLDVSASALREAAARIATDYSDLVVHGVVGDFTEHLDLLPGDAPRMVAFLGGTVGNFVPAERAKLLSSVRAVLDTGEWLLLGTDLVKDPATLIAAYDDESGITAEFNRNVLRVLNRELGADFDVDAFDHVTLWDPGNEWIEMRLRSIRPVHARLPEVDLDIDFAEGEELRTEISAKFRYERVITELAAAGFELVHWWTDSADQFAVSLAVARE